MPPKHFSDWVNRPTPSWKISDVLAWLSSNGFEEPVLKKFTEHKIDGLALLLLNECDLREMLINNIGTRKHLISCIKDLNHIPKTYKNYDYPSLAGDYHELSRMNSERSRENSVSADISPLDPELWKVGISFAYVFIVMGITAFVMVLAHERLPDMSKYPPLPDLFLDNLPHIPWAFEAAEAVGVILLIIWMVIIIFHQHRFILLRRYFSLMGTVFLLRSVTMLITSLSVPGTHLHEQCKPHIFNSLQEKVNRAREIWLGFGMTLKGVQTCGDYMFSGHTVVLTLLNFFITEYTPRSYYQLHIVSWVLNLFGIFFILAGHEHYSIDVFVAFYIASRLFLYYHWLSNNCNLMKRDQRRARIWFPLFSFFESRTNSVVPNRFEIPFAELLKKYCRVCKQKFL